MTNPQLEDILVTSPQKKSNPNRGGHTLLSHPYKKYVLFRVSLSWVISVDGTTMNFNLTEKFSIAQSDTTLKGPHNLINTMAAVTAVYLAGVKVSSIRF